MIELTWPLGLGMAVLSGLWLLVALRRSAGGDTRMRERINAAAYREQLAMLEARQAAGEIGAEDFAVDKAALDRRLVTESGSVPDYRQNRFGPLGLALIVLLPATLGAGIFWASDGAQHFAAAEETATPSVEEMVAGLARRLEAEPDDLRGWAMLGRSYSVLSRHRDAARAYAQANRLSGGQNAELLIAEAEALALTREQDFEGRPSRLLDEALALEPNHVRGLWYAVLAAGQRGDSAAQQDYLERLRAQPELPPELAEILAAQFGADAPAAATAAVTVEVDASDAARRSAAGSVLFVFAKARNGPPMPLAVHRQPAPSSWPIEVTLDDSMAMVAGRNLSSAQVWTLTARLSHSGQAQAASGDWQGQVEADSATPEPVRIRIDQQLP